MDRAEVRLLLSVYRADDSAAGGARLTEALAQVDADPELARWWKEEQEVDRIIASKLATTHVPAGLKARLLSAAEPRPSPVRPAWSRAVLLAAASIVALAVLFSSWRGPFQPAVSIADFRNEMVSFVKVAPSLEMESSDMGRVKDFLAKANAPAQFTVPKKLQKYDPIGCRVLRFRGEDVSLICFKISDAKPAHLFVTSPKKIGTVRRASAPVYASEQGWMTASWTEGGNTYLLAVKAERAELEKILGTS